MIFIERDKAGGICALRLGAEEAGLEPASLLDEEVLDFLRSTGEIESLSHLLIQSDASIVRILEDLVDLLIDKKLILFTELPLAAQSKLQSRKQLRSRISNDHLMVDDIL